VVGAAREVGIGRVFGLIALVLVFGLGFSVLSPLILHLCSFFLIFRFDVGLIEQVRDRRLDAAKMRWVRTIINGTLNPF
jgi:hypothetical protein